MLIQNKTGDAGLPPHAASMPHVVPPPVAAEPAPEPAPTETGTPTPPKTTQHRSAASVALHWALMVGGFLALVLLGQWLP